MGTKTPKPPPTIDYAGAAAAQGAANVTAAGQTTALSNPNIVGPYGNQTVTYAPDAQGNMQPTVTQTLNADAQKALTSQQKTQAGLAGIGENLTNQVSGSLSKPFQFNGPDIQTSLGPQRSIDYGPSAGMYGLAGGGPAANAYGLAGGGPAADAYGLASGISGDKYGVAQRSLDLSGIAQMPVNAGMTGQAAILSRLQPQIQQEQAALNQQLANQGITPGSEAYNNAMRTQGQQANDLYTQAALQGINLDTAANQQGFGQQLSQAGLYNQGLGQDFGQGLSAQQLTNASVGQNFGQGQAAQAMQNAAIAQNFGQGQAAQGMQNQSIGQNFGQGQAAAGLYNQAQNQGYNQNLQTAQFGNNASDNALARALQLRSQPLNEIQSLMSGSQIQNPQFQGYTGANVAAAPTLQGVQLQGQQAQDIYGQQMAARNANMAAYGQAAGMAGQAIMMSDIRLKSNIVKVGEHPLGIGIYEYDIFDRREHGVMAQEVLTVKPEAVAQHSSGYLMVDYGAL
jgi:hypothetical protein